MSRPVKRSLTLHQPRTSVTLEDEFWQAFREIAEPDQAGGRAEGAGEIFGEQARAAAGPRDRKRRGRGQGRPRAGHRQCVVVPRFARDQQAAEHLR